jgi:hypothetical protein
LRKAVAAVVACNLRFNKSPTEVARKKEELGIVGELTKQQVKEYRERYPFTN